MLVASAIAVVTLSTDFLARLRLSHAGWTLIGIDTALAWVGGAAGLLLSITFFLGIPAIVGALVRLWPMKLLFSHYARANDAPGVGRFLLMVFLFFEATVVLAACLSFGLKDTELLWRLLFCQVVSLPWLCSSVWVGRQLLLTERGRVVT